MCLHGGSGGRRGAGSKKCVAPYYNLPIAEPDKTMMGGGYCRTHLHPSAAEPWFPM